MVNTNPGAENGYDERVDIDDCTNFVSYQIDKKIKRTQTSDISRWDECISTMEKDISVKHAKYSNTLFREIIWLIYITPLVLCIVLFFLF